jgi:hypothetical protein
MLNCYEYLIGWFNHELNCFGYLYLFGVSIFMCFLFYILKYMDYISHSRPFSSTFIFFRHLIHSPSIGEHSFFFFLDISIFSIFYNIFIIMSKWNLACELINIIKRVYYSDLSWGVSKQLNTSSIFQSSITTPATSFSQVAQAKHARVSFVKVLSFDNICIS